MRVLRRRLRRPASRSAAVGSTCRAGSAPSPRAGRWSNSPLGERETLRNAGRRSWSWTRRSPSSGRSTSARYVAEDRATTPRHRAQPVKSARSESQARPRARRYGGLEHVADQPRRATGRGRPRRRARRRTTRARRRPRPRPRSPAAPRARRAASGGASRITRCQTRTQRVRAWPLEGAQRHVAHAADAHGAQHPGHGGRGPGLRDPRRRRARQPLRLAQQQPRGRWSPAGEVGVRRGDRLASRGRPAGPGS